MAQIARGPDDLYCPLTLSAPLGPSRMSKTCHKCPLWVKLRGTDKNTGEFVDEWRCSLGALPMLLIENASMVRAVDGNIDMLRKEQEAQHDEYKKYTAANIRAVQQVTTTILDNAPAQKLLPSGGSDADK